MSLGQVVDMDDVQRGIDKGRNLAVEEIDHQFAGRGRPDVPGPIGKVGSTKVTGAPCAAARSTSCSATYLVRL